MRFLKNAITFCVTACMALMCSSTPVYAVSYGHEECVWHGVLVNNKQSNYKFVVYPSAFNSTLTYSTYSYITSWNNISDNVHTQKLFYSPDLQNQNYERIEGCDLGDNILGRMIPYDCSNQPFDENTNPILNSNWYRVVIKVNTRQYNFSNSYQTIFSYYSTPYCTPAQLANSTIIHEVGHALKLKHPKKDCSLFYHMHNFNDYPSSIMNEGIRDASTLYISNTITIHDECELKFKWD